MKEITEAISKVMPTKKEKYMDINWNFTKCRAKYKERNSANYTFYIIDYDIPEDYEKYENIIEMRNKGVVKIKYFHTKKKVMKFLHKYQNGEIK